MALLNIIKKKKETEKPAEKEAKKESLKKKPAEKLKKTGKTVSSTAYRLLREPHISEKATDLNKKDWYVFKVFPGANKTEVKKAVEELYGVDVVSVRVINIPRKKRRLGRIEGWRKSHKKAIVRLKEGQKIEVLPR